MSSIDCGGVRSPPYPSREKPVANANRIVKAVTRDVLGLPAYSGSEAALYIHTPPSTLNSWFSGGVNFAPVFDFPEGSRLLSFRNLVEAHVLSSIRNQGVSLQKMRRAIAYMKKEYDSAHPLIEVDMETDGTDVFVDQLTLDGLGHPVVESVTQEGQIVLKELLRRYLKRIERDEGIAVRFFPFIDPPRSDSEGCSAADDAAIVMINPKISFGRPVIKGTGIPTAVLAERYQGGDSFEVLSQDYGQEPRIIEDAIRFEARHLLAA